MIPDGLRLGPERFWTRERVIAGLVFASFEIEGQLPNSDRPYLVMKKGRYDWPPVTRIYEYFGTMSDAWEAAGLEKSRISRDYHQWMPDDEEYLMEHAGEKTLKQIGKHLRRSWSACKRRLYDLHLKARDNQGFFTAAEVSKEYNCSYDRVRRLIISGEIPCRYDPPRNRYQIHPDALTADVIKRLQAPRITHKTEPLDKGDYEKRHRLQRRRINGKVMRIDKETT